MRLTQKKVEERIKKGKISIKDVIDNPCEVHKYLVKLYGSVAEPEFSENSIKFHIRDKSYENNDVEMGNHFLLTKYIKESMFDYEGFKKMVMHLCRMCVPVHVMVVFIQSIQSANRMYLELHKEELSEAENEHVIH